MAALGHIPVADEVFTRDGAEVTVLDAEPTRIHKLRMVVAAPPKPEVPSEDTAI
jgi:CBS domain containing-hemolysin-like protein